MSEKQDINKVDRSRAVLIKGKVKKNDFVDASLANRVEMIWQITQELWSLTGRTNPQQPMRRDVAILKKQSRT